MSGKQKDYFGLNFTAVGDAVITMRAVGETESSSGTLSLVVSRDLESWEPFIVGTTEVRLSDGERVYFKTQHTTTQRFSVSKTSYYQFVVSGKVEARGSLQSLINAEFTSSALYDFCFARLFYRCTGLLRAPDLTATEVGMGCYYETFRDCTALARAPFISALSLSDGSFCNTFFGCKSLVSAPTILPAVNLAPKCYHGMFRGCTALTTPVELLPALSAARECYGYMYQGCTSLRSTGELCLVSTDIACCDSMFSGCTSLTNPPPFLYASRLSSRCYKSMFYRCTSLTVPPNMDTVSYAGSDCCSYMFAGDDSLQTAPRLPAKEIERGCYNSMFTGCRSLATAPELPAQTLYTGCYEKMFKDCTSLQSLPVLPALDIPTRGYAEMFSGCTALHFQGADPYRFPVKTAGNSACQGMFSGCTGLTAFPGLAVQEVGRDSMNQMFRGCSGAIMVSAAPIVLDSSDAPDRCYYQMFYGCSSLQRPPELNASDLGRQSCYEMFRGCENLTRSPFLYTRSLKDADNCYSGMFYGCSSLSVIQTCQNGFENCRNWVAHVGDSGQFCSTTAFSADTVEQNRGDSGIPDGWEFTVIQDVPADDNTEIESAGTLSLKFQNIDASGAYATVMLRKTGDPAPLKLLYSFSDDGPWYNLIPDVTVIPIPFNGILRLKAAEGSTGFSTGAFDYYSFVVTGSVKVWGDLAGLLPEDEQGQRPLQPYCFYNLFMDAAGLKDASGIDMPWTVLKSHCFYGMFFRCTGLQSVAPLPATELAEACYGFMYYGCTQLSESADLPAVSAMPNCYVGMYKNCKSLSNPGKIDLNSSADFCCRQMFMGCESLAISPVLHAENLTGTGCYEEMFSGCVNLRAIWTEQTSFNGCTNWVYGVQTTEGYFRCDRDAFPVMSYGVSACPEGWQVPNIHDGAFFYLQAKADNVVVRFNCSGLHTMNLEESADGENWTTCVCNDAWERVLEKSGDCVYFRAVPPGNTGTGTSLTDFVKFEISGPAAAGGTIRALLTPPGELQTTSPEKLGRYSFYRLFANTDLVNAPELPFHELGEYCYQEMFEGCTQLSAPPELPAWELPAGCYYRMFAGSGVPRAAAIDAGKLSSSCCANMYEGCTSLTSVATLPGHATAPYCFAGMFFGCSSLAGNLVLGFEEVGDYSCSNMFSGCTSLTGLTFSKGSLRTVGQCGCEGMFMNCRNLGRIVTNAVTTENTSPYCFRNMFRDCSNALLGQSFTLVSTAPGCCQGMFSRCSENFTDGSVVHLPSQQTSSACYESMFSGCTRLTSTPALPAVLLSPSCYARMFYGCSSLKSSPYLPAVELVDQCYRSMFEGCSSLTYVQTEQTSFIGCGSWLLGVGTVNAYFNAPQILGDEETIERGPSACPVGWYVTEKHNYSGLCFTCTGGTESTVAMTKSGDPDPITLQISRDGKSWTDYEINTPVYLHPGGCVFFRAGPGGNDRINDPSAPYGSYYRFTFGGDGPINASGNIQSLLDDSMPVKVPDHCYYQLFYNIDRIGHLVSPPELPATELGYRCYQFMFQGSGIRTPPELPATVLSGDCYYGMFSGCGSLSRGADLPAKSLQSNCYAWMYNGCYTMKHPGTVAATSTAHRSCYRMFNGCAMITEAPRLLSIDLVSECYAYMFTGCTLLKKIATCQNTFDHCAEWVQGVGPEGEFFATSTLIGSGPDYDEVPTGTSACPEGWLIKNFSEFDPVLLVDYLCFEAEESGVTVAFEKVGAPPDVVIEYSFDKLNWRTYEFDLEVRLENRGTRVYFRAGPNGNPVLSYYGFNGTPQYHRFNIHGTVRASGSVMSLVDRTVPDEFPGDAEGSMCYLFSGNPGILTPPILPAQTLYNRCYYGMFQNCTGLTKAPDLPAKSLPIECYAYMFDGCVSLMTPCQALELTSCYRHSCYRMFQRCVSLTEAPRISVSSAGSVGSSSFCRMFFGCLRLTRVPCLALGKCGSYALQSMFENCVSLDLIEGESFLTVSPDGKYGASRMFYGCVCLTNAPSIVVTSSTSARPTSALEQMFCLCSRLVSPPEITATRNGTRGCHSMFAHCVSLEEASIPFTSSWSDAYVQMFYGCLNLHLVYTLQTTFDGCDSWLEGVRTDGELHCTEELTDLADQHRGPSGCPVNWDVVQID